MESRCGSWGVGGIIRLWRVEGGGQRFFMETKVARGVFSAMVQQSTFTAARPTLPFVPFPLHRL